MKAVWLIPVIASILILGVLGLSQDAMAANLSVTDQFSDVHFVDETMFTTSSPDACGSTHHHAVSGGVVTSTLGVVISDPAPTVCGYGIVGGALTGTIVPVDEFFSFHIEATIDCSKAPPEFRALSNVEVRLTDGTLIAAQPLPDCIGGDSFPMMAEAGPFVTPPGFDLFDAPDAVDWTVNIDSSNGEEEKACDKKLRVDKENEIKGKIRCGLKKALGAVIIKIISIIVSVGPV